MTKKVKPTKLSGKAIFSSQQLQMALLHVFDMFDSAHVQFVVLGTVGKCLYDGKENELRGDKIVIGVKEKEISEYAISTINSFYIGKSDKMKKEKYGYSLTFENVPIKIKVIKKKYEFMERPDVRFLATESMLIPNPFGDYWKRRMLI